MGARGAMAMSANLNGGRDPTRFKPYPAYKDSGVEWLGKIPAHWRMTKMWDVADAASGGTPAKETLRYWDGGIPWVSPKDMKRRFIDSSEDTVSAAAVSETGLKLVANPAVLVVVRGMILAHSFPVGITKVPVTINQDMKALRLRDDVDPEFFGYWLEGVGRDLLAVLVDEAAHGTKAIRMDRWRVTPVQIPPEDEQRAIVDFLDREMAKLDALVEKKGRVIELLQEKRTALITQAVTKGLDPNVVMKDSGVEWPGTVPADWKVRKVKRLCLVRRGASPRPIDDPIYFEEDGEYAWVRIADVTSSDRYLERTTQRLSDLGRSKSVPLEPGELFVSIAATVGKPVITKDQVLHPRRLRLLRRSSREPRVSVLPLLVWRAIQGAWEARHAIESEHGHHRRHLSANTIADRATVDRAIPRS